MQKVHLIAAIWCKNFLKWPSGSQEAMNPFETLWTFTMCRLLALSALDSTLWFPQCSEMGKSKPSNFKVHTPLGFAPNSH